MSDKLIGPQPIIGPGDSPDKIGGSAPMTQYTPIDESARLAIFGYNPSTGKAFTPQESAAVNGGYNPYEGAVGYQVDPRTGNLNVLKSNGTVMTTGATYRQTPSGGIVPNKPVGFQYNDAGIPINAQGNPITYEDINNYNASVSSRSTSTKSVSSSPSPTKVDPTPLSPSTVSPTPSTVSPVAQTISAPPVKTAPIDTILYPSDDQLPVEIMADLIFENIGGQEIINIARTDTVNGQPVVYQPIKNLTQIQQQYNPNNIVALQATSDKYFQNFSIKLETKIPEEGTGPNQTHVYIDPVTGDLVIECVNMKEDEQVELEVTVSGTIYEAEL